MTDFHVDVVRLGAIEKHPNADLLEITQVHGGYPCIIKKGQFKEGDLAVYIPVDSVIPDLPEYSFLTGSEHKRLKAKKLRGLFSMGLLMPSPPSASEGDDVATLLGITKYQPPEPGTHHQGKTGSTKMSSYSEKCPFDFPEYTDLEPLRRHMNILQEGEEVVLTEKIHGSNYRAVHDGKRLWVGSRTVIRKNPNARTWWERLVDMTYALVGLKKDHRAPPSDLWWNIAQELRLEEKLALAPNYVFFGEVFGPGVQDLTYGQAKPAFRVFDVMDLATKTYLNHNLACGYAKLVGLDWVPELYRGPWHPDCLDFCEGRTTLGAKHCIEGFVVKPVRERFDGRVGRVILKMVGENYHMRKSDNS